MFGEPAVDYKAAHDLIINLIELYEKNKATFKSEKASINEDM